MKILQSIPTLICALLITSVCSHAEQLASAKVVAVNGTAVKYSSDGSENRLKVGDILKQGDELKVTALSSTDLVFSNGSEVTVNENSSLMFAKLEQEAFNSGQSYEQLQADPSKSQTLLKLDYGDLDFHVKKLQPGSRFDIETPLGTAAIRGTRGTVGISFSNGQFVLNITNVDGKIDVVDSDGNVTPLAAGATTTQNIGPGDPAFAALQAAMTSDPTGETPAQTIIDIIALTTPEITPEDPGITTNNPVITPIDPSVIIVSPEVEFDVNIDNSALQTPAATQE